MMWECVQPGRCVLLEMPSRWYLGIVAKRTAGTAVLEAPALCVHDTGDLGLFLAGTPGEGCERTPLPRGLEIGLPSLDSAQDYPVAAFRRICSRSHTPQGGRA